MIYFLALLPATALTIAGYFVLYLSARSEGTLRAFGRYLGFWAFTLAGLIILGAVFAAAHGRHHCPVLGLQSMHERMSGPWPRAEQPHDAAPPAGAPPAAQAPGTARDPTAAPNAPAPSQR